MTNLRDDFDEKIKRIFTDNEKIVDGYIYTEGQCESWKACKEMEINNLLTWIENKIREGKEEMLEYA